jgi:hypothetical protein
MLCRSCHHYTRQQHSPHKMQGLHAAACLPRTSGTVHQSLRSTRHRCQSKAGTRCDQRSDSSQDHTASTQRRQCSLSYPPQLCKDHSALCHSTAACPQHRFDNGPHHCTRQQHSPHTSPASLGQAFCRCRTRYRLRQPSCTAQPDGCTPVYCEWRSNAGDKRTERTRAPAGRLAQQQRRLQLHKNSWTHILHIALGTMTTASLGLSEWLPDSCWLLPSKLCM